MIGLANSPESKPALVTGRGFISWSQLSTFRQCPLRYRFRYLDRLEPEFVASSLLVGSSIHSAIELFHRRQLEGGEPPTLDELLSEFWEEWRSRVEESPEVRFAKNEDFSSVHDLARRMLSAFLADDTSQIHGVPIAIEESILSNVLDGNRPLLGIIDLIIKSPDKIIVRDYKTSRSKWNRAIAESSSDQILLYGELVQPLFPDKRLSFEFVVITKTKSPAVQLFSIGSDSKRVVRTKRVPNLTLDAIATGMFYPNKSAMNCSGCPYRSACSKWSG